MIEGLVGLPGQGKTLWAVKRMLEERKRKRRVLSNLFSRCGEWEFGLWQDMTEAFNCFVVIDEAHMWFSARAWHDTKQSELSVFQQSRKEGVDLLWIAQHQNRIDTAVREVTAFIWSTRKFGNYFLLRKFQEAEPRVTLKRVLWRIDRSVSRHYWTEQRIGDRHGEGYGFGRTDAYGARAGASVVRVGTKLVLSPNAFRIEFPTHIRWLASDAPGLAGEAAEAGRFWRAAGIQKDAGAICTPVYVSDGGAFVEIKETGFVPAEAPKAILDQVREAGRAIRHDVISILPQGLAAQRAKR